MAMVCNGHLEIKVSKENFVSIQLAICGLVDGLPEEFISRLISTCWAKGAAIMVCQDEETRDWLGSQVPTLKDWEGSRLKTGWLNALPTYKRLVAWFLGSVEDMECYFQ